MGSIADNLRQIRATLPPEGVELVAVSKFHPAEAIAAAYAAGQRSFGESRANELKTKAETLPDDIRWHFIGHLQTNKVRPVVAIASLIHSVDSARLLDAIDNEAARIGRPIDVLLQIHVAKEETKFGFHPDELIDFLTPERVASLKAARIAGVMGMASNTDDSDRITADFRAIRQVFDTLSSGVMATYPGFNIVSMGMSHDYLAAVDEGSNMVRVGSAIFGDRDY